MPQAVEEIYDCLETKPSAVMICLTCVDALLGTDMERICKKAQKSVGIPVLPCYMYALTREGRKPDGTCQTVNLFFVRTKKEEEYFCESIRAFCSVRRWL